MCASLMQSNGFTPLHLNAYVQNPQTAGDVILESEHHFAWPIHSSTALDVSTMKGSTLLYVGVWNTLHEDVRHGKLPW